MMTDSLRLELQRRLAHLLGEGEARAVTLLLFEHIGGLSTVDVLTGRDAELPEETKEKLRAAARRVEQGEPVQYVIGKTVFMGLELKVSPAVLIPRPETEDLVRLLISENKGLNDGKVLDIGTGSGCIALAVKHQMPDTRVTAWDVSEKALEVAHHNALKNGLDVKFQLKDILLPQQSADHFDIIVSNPPYVCTSEEAEMERQVLDFEPHTALFVPDDDPLLFYRAIARLGQKHLKKGGSLYFEINAAFGEPTCQLLRQMGYRDVELRRDITGRDRMVKALYR